MGKKQPPNFGICLSTWQTCIVKKIILLLLLFSYYILWLWNAEQFNSALIFLTSNPWVMHKNERSADRMQWPFAKWLTFHQDPDNKNAVQLFGYRPLTPFHPTQSSVLTIRQTHAQGTHNHARIRGCAHSSRLFHVYFTSYLQCKFTLHT